MQPYNFLEDAPGLDGPDYVALVIEWNDDDVVTLVSEPTPERSPDTFRMIATVAGALGALVLATWGLRHLRAA